MRLSHLVRFLRRQDGISLVMAVGTLGVLSLTGTTLIHYSTANARSAEYSKDNAGAYDIAEAGINEMMAILFKPENNPMNPYLLGAQPDGTVVKTTRTYDAGTVEWWGTLDQTVNPVTWRLTSIGRIKNPTGAASNVTRTLTANVAVKPRYSQPLANQVWNYFYVFGTGAADGCDYSQANSTSMASPLYVAGNACFANTAWASSGPIHVHGTVTFKNDSKIGESSTNPVTKGVHIKGGCKAPGQSTFTAPCTATQRVYADPAATTSPITLSTPVPDWSAWYLNASPGPYYPCQSPSGTPLTFDNDQGSPLTPDANKANKSVATQSLTPTTSYACKTPNGELTWNASTTDSSTFGPAKTLTMWGTIFVDGNLRIDHGGVVKWRGQGTIFNSGSFVIKNTNFCHVVSEDGSTCYWTLDQPGSWNPNTNFFEIVTGWKCSTASPCLQNDITESDLVFNFVSAAYQGGLQSVGRVAVTTSTSTQGPLVMQRVTLSQALMTYPFPTIEWVPVATPGNNPSYGVPEPPQDYSG